MADNSKLFLYGGIAIAAWYLYENWSTLFPVAAAAPATPSTPASGTGTGAAVPPNSGTTTGSGSTAGAGGATPSAGSLAAIYSALVAAVAASLAGGNPAITAGPTATPDVFNYFLAQVLAAPPKPSPYGWPPDVAQVFSGVDRTQPMSITTYWAGMSSYLTSRVGMSGLGRLRGMGCVSQYERAYVTPDNPTNGGYLLQ
jgi:hypothetical protein